MIVVGSVLAPFKMDPQGYPLAWLDPVLAHPEHEVRYFAALETDARGLEPYQPLLDHLDGIGRVYDLTVDRWTYQLDTGATRIETGGDRHYRVCTGRNMIVEYAHRHQADWVLFLDADVTPPADLLERLLELDYPCVAAHVPTYRLDGPPVQHRAAAYPNLRAVAELAETRRWDVREHWTTAGCLAWRADVYRRVSWRWGWPHFTDSDDLTTQTLTAELGWPTVVRHDVTARHNPECIGPLETRGHDLEIYR